MNCEQAQLLISAKIDDEIAPADRARLDTHLHDCSACQAAAEAVQQQDAELRALFASRQPAVTAVIERVIAQLPVTRRHSVRRRPWLAIVGALTAAAAGFLAALVLVRPDPVERPVPGPVREVVVHRPVYILDPVFPELKEASGAQTLLALATGPVEMLSTDDQDWKAMSPGATIEYGTCVRTPPKVRCEFKCPDGSEVRLNGGTQVYFAADRKFRVDNGQSYFAFTKGETPFEVESPDAIITAMDSQFDLACQPQKEGSQTVVTVFEGKTRVDGKSKQKSKDAADGLELVRGQRTSIVDGTVGEPHAVYQLAQAANWVNEILVMKGADNPELQKRVYGMLAQLGEAKLDFLNDAEIRSLGDRCVVPLTKYVESSDSVTKAKHRQHAMRLLADLAQPWSIPDLIGLLADDDKEVRYLAAKTLHRLAGQNPEVPNALPPTEWRDRPLSACVTERQRWERWWKANKHRYPKAP